MVKELPYFDDTIEFDVLLARSLRLDVYDLVNCLLFNAFNIDLLRGQVLGHVRSVHERWKIWSKQLHIKYCMQSKKIGNT